MEIFIGLIIGAVVSATILKIVSNMVYKRTGHNGLKGLPKFLMYAEGIALLAAIGLLESNLVSMPIIIISLVIAIGLFILANIKAGITYAAILAVTQVVCGGLVALLMIVNFLLGLFTGGKTSALGSLFSINEEKIGITQQATEDNIKRVQKDASIAKEERNGQADAFAQKQGFVDSEDAEAAGIKTGKQF